MIIYNYRGLIEGDELLEKFNWDQKYIYIVSDSSCTLFQINLSSSLFLLGDSFIRLKRFMDKFSE